MNSSYTYTPISYDTMGNGTMMPANTTDDRFFGGFFGPFILGGITGGLLAPAFNNNYGRPNYYSNYNNYYYPPYYYPYSPYYY